VTGKLGPMPDISGSILRAAVKRVEDPRFIRGEGRYIANLAVPPGTLHVAFVRSPIPHGRLEGVDVAEARAMPGVVAVYTAADLDLPAIPAGLRMVPAEANRPVLATDTVRMVGELVAVVVAETERQAVDAADTVWPEIDPIDGVAGVVEAATDDAPRLFPEVGTNVMWDTNPDMATGPLTGAEVTIKTRFVNQRLAAVPLEGNATLAIPTPDGLDVYLGSQNVFGHRREMGHVLGLENHELRIVVPDMGGGFGAKFAAYPEQIATAAVARKLNRPARWIETRTENLAAMYHGRDQVQDVELGATSDGRIVGLRVTFWQNAGAYPTFGTYSPYMTAKMASGVYAIPTIETRIISVATNTAPTHAYRGAGRPEATAMIERAVDMLARRLDMDPAELRRVNLIGADAFPYRTPTKAEYDSGDYHMVLDRVLAMADYDGLRVEQARRRERNVRKQLGIGLSVYVEITAPFGGKEFARVEVHESGKVTAYSGTLSHGQGHATAYAQIVGSLFKIPHTDVTVIQGDTARVARGEGTGGSRSLQLGGSAVLGAGEAVVDKAKAIMAHLLEASAEDIVVMDGGRLGVAGVPDTARTWAELATLANERDALPDELEPGLEADFDFDQPGSSFPFGAHVTVVEVDTETGETELLTVFAVDDCGTIFNRLLVYGQIHGGIEQGAGQALLEHFVYDPEGYPLTGNLTTYMIPNSTTVPKVRLSPTETPTPLNPLGAKGIGESGTIGSTPSVQNAVIDAVSYLGIDHIDMPLTPQRVWQAIHAATT